jgi:peroxiredoxin Q/BCP
MKNRRAVGLALGLLLAVSGGVRQASAVELKVGDRAPAFTLTGSDGEKHSLEQFRGKRVVVLAWFPKAFTGG